jgi:hypothetical protein
MATLCPFHWRAVRIAGNREEIGSGCYGRSAKGCRLSDVVEGAVWELADAGGEERVADQVGRSCRDAGGDVRCEVAARPGGWSRASSAEVSRRALRGLFEFGDGFGSFG